jgi:NADH dehydrogenase FAD-containing subunit
MTRRLVMLGAGHAHLHAIKRAEEFARRGHELVVVAPEPFWYSGLATGMLGGRYPPELDRVDVATLLGPHGRFLRDRVTGIDVAARKVQLAESPPLGYDVLSLNLGSVVPEIPGLSDGYAAKPIEQLWRLRLDLEDRFRHAPDDPVCVVVAGGGVTGVEIAANIAGLARLRGGRLALTVLVAGERPLPTLPRGAAERVVAALERRGIIFRANSRAERVEHRSVVLGSGERLPFDLLVNATGLRPAPLIRDSGLPVDAQGALLVDAHLRSVADPAVHGGGDGIALSGHDLPKVGVHAIRQGPVLQQNLLASLEGTQPARYRPQKDHLWIMNLGDGTGLAVRRNVWWHGQAAFRLKDWIDRRFLAEYRSDGPSSASSGGA